MTRDLGATALTALRFGLAALAGFVVAAIVVLNLHIVVGLEEGYAASPADVLAHSPLLAVVDVVLLVSAPVLGVALTARLRRRRER
jgi:hypothetical protein